MKTYLFPSIELLLLALASYVAVGLFYQVTTADLGFLLTSTAPVRSVTANPGPAGGPALADYRAITERNLFRTVDPEKVQNKSKPVDLAALQETKLDLKLWGTLVLSEGGRSYAVIEDKKAGGQNLYQVGDKVQDAQVKMVLRERVVLDVGGKDEILQLEELVASTTGAGQAPAPLPASAPVEGPPPAEPAVREVNLERKAIEAAMGNVGELMKQVRIRPFFEGGKPAGLSLAGVAPGSIFEQMGIRNGDVLQAVDGQPIQSVDDIVNLYQSLSSAGNIAIQVRRGGRIEDIQYKIE
jgi:general secretion pathway protein C